MERKKQIGIVVGIERLASNPLDCWVYIEQGENIQLDDIVLIETIDSGGEIRKLYGIVDEMQKTLEGADFASDAKLYPGILPTNLAEVAHVSILRVEPQTFNPPNPGAAVFQASGEDFNQALYKDEMEHSFPLGHTRQGLANQEVIYGNFEFLDGTRGAHINISGISGVATKTSYATFLLKSIYTHLDKDVAPNTKAIIFNVKGEDLMYLDHKAPDGKITENHIEMYDLMGLKPEPFDSVQFYSKPLKAGVKRKDSRDNRLLLRWSLEEFCEQEYIRLLFTEDDFGNTQIEQFVNLAATKLKEEYSKDNEISNCTNITDLIELINKNTNPGQDTSPSSDGIIPGKWLKNPRQANEGTWAAFIRRLNNAGQFVKDILDNDKNDSGINWKENANITVIDIHQFHARAQRFIVGIVLQDIIQHREATDQGDRNNPIFIVLDELNKYAPKDSSSPIKEYLVDIAERGRSMNIILIGAQQTASEIEPRVVANSAFRVVGRLDAAESEKSEYGYLSQAAKTRTRLLQPGTMMVTQPQIPIPILLQFPFPAWATNKSAMPSDARKSRQDIKNDLENKNE